MQWEDPVATAATLETALADAVETTDTITAEEKEAKAEAEAAAEAAAAAERKEQGLVTIDEFEKLTARWVVR